jgi:hypothetical protein
VIGCDHNSIEFNVQYKGVPEPEAPSVIIHDFKHADFAGLNMFLSNVDWNNVLTTTSDVDVMWNKFISVINNAMELYVPEKKIFTTNRKHFKKYPLYIRKLLNKKCVAWRIYKRFRTGGTKARYIQCDKQCKFAIDRFIAKQESRLIDGGQIGDFYRYVNNKIVSKSRVGLLKNDKGENVLNDSDKTELLSRFFRLCLLLITMLCPTYQMLQMRRNCLKK